MAPTLVLGAGMAGLTAARHLAAHGVDVKVLDKGSGVGGRMATRRFGEATFDHGAQFFTTRGEAFTEVVAEAISEGAATEWCRGFGIPDGFPRFRGTQGMTAVPKWLAHGLDVSLGVEIDRIETRDDAIEFRTAKDELVAAGSSAIITPPVPQMLALFDRGGVNLDEALDADLRQTAYFATLALLVVVDGPTNIAEPGGMQHTEGPFTFVADNRRKGISEVHALTFHAEHDYSLRHFDDDPNAVTEALLQQAAPWIGEAAVVSAQLKRWRYAGPVTPLPFATAVIETSGGPIALAGDAFAGPKVEGAFNSGLAAAQAIVDAHR